MKILENLIEKVKEHKIVERTYYFKYTHKLYWSKTMSDGRVELWAHDSQSNEKWYLGKYQEGKITECDGFYNLGISWDIQKGAERLFRMVEKDLQ